ncbi:MAG TPA: hypothetical protein VK783_09135 [Bacteroidia bacterium]|jgi:hypothetical protein|nr:hypothetical protein [Bacteroidia bacterium]
MQPPQVLETKYAHHSIEEDVICIVWAKNLVINIDIAKEMVEERIKFCNGKEMPCLIDIRGLATIDTVSRKYFAGERSITGIIAGALVVDSLVSKLAGNIYITVDKPQIPVRLFNDERKALKWLKQFKK